MRVKKCVCPECGGNLFYWKEYVTETRRNINPYTGVVSKTAKKTHADSNEVGNEGLQCEECDWQYNTISMQGVGKEINTEELLNLIKEMH